MYILPLENVDDILMKDKILLIQITTIQFLVNIQILHASLKKFTSCMRLPDAKQWGCGPLNPEEGLGAVTLADLVALLPPAAQAVHGPLAA